MKNDITYSENTPIYIKRRLEEYLAHCCAPCGHSLKSWLNDNDPMCWWTHWGVRSTMYPEKRTHLWYIHTWPALPPLTYLNWHLPTSSLMALVLCWGTMTHALVILSLFTQQGFFECPFCIQYPLNHGRQGKEGNMVKCRKKRNKPRSSWPQGACGVYRKPRLTLWKSQRKKASA